MRYLRFGLLLLGAALLVVLVIRNDPAAILASIAQVSWGLLVILCFPVLVVTVLDTLAWRFAFRRPPVGFPTLFAARLAGEAFNMTTPTAAVGGEAVKAWLLRGRVPLEESLSSVIIAKTTITIAQGLFLVVGMVLAWRTLPADSAVLMGMQWLLVAEVLALGGFVAVQARGVIGWGGRLLARAGLPLRLGRQELLLRVSDVLTGFYRTERRRLAISIAFDFVAWLLGSLESYLILRFLGLRVSLTTATVIEAFGTGVRFATFLIPASLGVLEGGYAAIFASLGLGSTAGVSFSLVRRVREMVWAGIGLIAFAVMRPAAETSGPPTAV